MVNLENGSGVSYLFHQYEPINLCKGLQLAVLTFGDLHVNSQIFWVGCGVYLSAYFE